MAQLRSVDPTTLIPNPENPRRTAAPPAMDDQLLASIKAVGIIQPPRVREMPDGLMIVAGWRRTKAAMRAGLEQIDVLVCDAEETADAMRSVSENLIRASMTSVDVWRATEALEKQGWNEQAIADALALPTRTVRRLKLLAHLHPAMLEFMSGGSMPNEEQLRTIANASRDEQAQVWKKNKPKKGTDVSWYHVAHALSKRRMPFSTAKFNDDLARAYGVVWEDDLFTPAGEEGRYTTNVEGFFGAQQEWLQNNLPERSTFLPTDEHGRHELPKKAEHVYGQPGKTDLRGYYLDPHSGEVRSIAYQMPEPKKAPKTGQNGKTGSEADQSEEATTKTRPDITQKGTAMIGDMRTDALHQALTESPIDDHTLIALLVLALGAKNVAVTCGNPDYLQTRYVSADTITSGGVITSDHATLVTAARETLKSVLYCRDNASNSGEVALLAGAAVDAAQFLPNMATEEFLSCLSKSGIGKAATAEGVRVEIRARDTRARMVDHFKKTTYLYPAALFNIPAASPSADLSTSSEGGDCSVDLDGDTDDEAEYADNDVPEEGRLAEAAD